MAINEKRYRRKRKMEVEGIEKKCKIREVRTAGTRA